MALTEAQKSILKTFRKPDGSTNQKKVKKASVGQRRAFIAAKTEEVKTGHPPNRPAGATRRGPRASN